MSNNIIDSIQLSGTVYTIQGTGGGGSPTVELTQAEYDALVSAGTVSANTYYIITDATPIETSGFVQTSAITSSVTSASTNSEIPTAKAVWEAASGGGGSITIDPTLNTGSTNAVANSAITNTIYNETARFVSKASDGYLVSLSARDSGNAIGIDGTKIKTLANGINQTSSSSWLYTSTINGKKAVSTSSSNTKDFNLVETSAITTAITSSSTDAQVPSAKAVNDKLGGLKLVKLTQSAYDALSPNYDSNTLYIIKD